MLMLVKYFFAVFYHGYEIHNILKGVSINFYQLRCTVVREFPSQHFALLLCSTVL